MMQSEALDMNRLLPHTAIAILPPLMILLDFEC